VSIRIMNLVFEMDLEPKPKIVMLTLADHADVDGYCFPGQGTLARRSSIPERTLRRVLQGLEEQGLIERERRTNEAGQRKTDGYRILPAILAGGSEPTGQNDAPNRPTVAGTKEPSVEPSDTPPTPSVDLAFELAWKHWPKKSGKQLALKAFRKSVDQHYAAAKKQEVTQAPADAEKWAPLSLIIDTVTRFGTAYGRTTPPQFIPHLATWLNGQRWSDDMPVDRTRGAYTPEPKANQPGKMTLPAGHRWVRDEMGNITGSEPIA
jgi:hypothetical protein